MTTHCEHCNSIDLVDYMPGKKFCLTCQRLTTISKGFTFQIIHQEPTESFEKTI